MPVKEIHSMAELENLIDSGKVILIYFYTTWCGPCKFISPDFETLSDRHSDPERVDFCRVDIDELPDIADGLRIRALPTFHAYKNGKSIIQAMVGGNRALLEAFVQKSVAQA